jgi:hypothetical protein
MKKVSFKSFKLIDENNNLIDYNAIIKRKKKIKKFFKKKSVVFLLAENNIELILEYLCFFLRQLRFSVHEFWKFCPSLSLEHCTFQ